MQLEKSLAVGSGMFTACHHRGLTYVGVDNYTISRFDIDGNQTQNFICLPNYPITFRANQDQLFVLVYGSPYQVMVYDLNGNQVKTWNHTDKNRSWNGNKLCIINNQVLAVDITNQRITVYSLDGKTERQITCPQMPNSTYISMCAAGGGDSVIITTHTPPAVFRFNLNTSAVVWKTDLTGNPFCSAVYGGAVLVGGCGCGNKRGVWIQVLNYETGEFKHKVR